MESSEQEEIVKKPQLFDLSPIDQIDSWQQELLDRYEQVLAIISKSEIEAHVALQEMASVNMEGHEKLIDGFTYGILTDLDKAATYYRNMLFVVRDGFAHLVSRLRQMSSSLRFGRLKEDCKKQLFWLLNELVKVNTSGVHQVLMIISKQMRGADISRTNIRLCQYMIEFTKMNKEWIYQSSELSATLFYAFSRLILDHNKFPELRDKECELVVSLVREKFLECSSIGRDMIRALQDIAMLPIIKPLWKDLLFNPEAINPQFEGVWQILRVPTNKTYLANRLSFDLEKKLTFILEKLKLSNFQRNLIWFSQSFLSTPESGSLFCDITRYLCGVFHPTNQQLASDLVPRYIVLGALLRMIRSPVVAANVKMALIYDLLFFDQTVDNIMNIEPLILLIDRSLDKYAYLTASLVEFVAFISESYYLDYSKDIRENVNKAVNFAIKKGVLSSLDPIYSHSKIPQLVKRQMLFLFPDLLSKKQGLLSKDSGFSDGRQLHASKEIFKTEEILKSKTPDASPRKASNLVFGSPKKNHGSQLFGNGDDYEAIESVTLSSIMSAKQGLGVTSLPKDSEIEFLPLYSDSDDLFESYSQRSNTPNDALGLNEIEDFEEKDGNSIKLNISGSKAASNQLEINSATQNASSSTREDTLLKKDGSEGLSDHVSTLKKIKDIQSQSESGDDTERGAPVDYDSDQSEGVSVGEDDFTLLQDKLIDNSLWIFGTVPSELADAVSSEDDDQAKQKLKDLFLMYIETDVSPSVLGAVLGLVFRLSNLEDVEMNREFELTGNESSVEHDLVYELCVLILNLYNGKNSKDADKDGDLDLKTSKPVSDTTTQRCISLLHHISLTFEPFGFRWLIFTVIKHKLPDLYKVYGSNLNRDELSQGSDDHPNYEFCLTENIKDTNFKNAFSYDINLFRESFELLFYQSLPTLYKYFPGVIAGNHKVLLTISESILQPQLHRVVFALSTNNLSLFGEKPSLILPFTLELEPSEQVSIWQLLKSEITGKTESINDLLLYFIENWSLDWSLHPEAANGLLMILSNSIPDAQILSKLVVFNYLSFLGDDGRYTPSDTKAASSNSPKPGTTLKFSTSNQLVLERYSFFNIVPLSVCAAWIKVFPQALISSFKDLLSSTELLESIKKVSNSENDLILDFLNLLRNTGLGFVNILDEIEKVVLSKSISQLYELSTPTSPETVLETKNMELNPNSGQIFNCKAHVPTTPQSPKIKIQEPNYQYNNDNGYSATTTNAFTQPANLTDSNGTESASQNQQDSLVDSKTGYSPKIPEGNDGVLNLSMIHQANIGANLNHYKLDQQFNQQSSNSGATLLPKILPNNNFQRQQTNPLDFMQLFSNNSNLYSHSNMNNSNFPSHGLMNVTGFLPGAPLQFSTTPTYPSTFGYNSLSERASRVSGAGASTSSMGFDSNQHLSYQQRLNAPNFTNMAASGLHQFYNNGNQSINNGNTEYGTQQPYHYQTNSLQVPFNPPINNKRNGSSQIDADQISSGMQTLQDPSHLIKRHKNGADADQENKL